MNIVCKILIISALPLAMGGCQTSFQAVKRDLPPVTDIVPTPLLCKRAKASDDLRVVALANKYCAAGNQTRLKDAAANYSKLVKCYNSGQCSE